jgi:hypothetical protein
MKTVVDFTAVAANVQHSPQFAAQCLRVALVQAASTWLACCATAMLGSGWCIVTCRTTQSTMSQLSLLAAGMLDTLQAAAFSGAMSQSRHVASSLPITHNCKGDTAMAGHHDATLRAANGHLAAHQQCTNLPVVLLQLALMPNCQGIHAARQDNSQLKATDKHALYQHQQNQSTCMQGCDLRSLPCQSRPCCHAAGFSQAHTAAHVPHTGCVTMAHGVC